MENENVLDEIAKGFGTVIGPEQILSAMIELNIGNVPKGFKKYAELNPKQARKLVQLYLDLTADQKKLIDAYIDATFELFGTI
jgi:hypothetical protein